MRSVSISVIQNVLEVTWIVMLKFWGVITLLMNQGVKYVEYVANMKDNNVNKFCIALLPTSAGDGCK
jgi:hypothetical protein